MQYAKHLRSTPQSIQVPGKNQIINAAGGAVFKIDSFERLKRFLILGSEGGSYYASEAKLTLENASCVIECLNNDYKKTISQIVEISDKGLAPKNDACIFSLAIASVNPNKECRKEAFLAVHKVCRIGTHIFQFVEAREAVGGGWGRTMRSTIHKWFDRPDVVLQALKYQQRNGWSQRDLLRLGHPKTETNMAIFEAICRPNSWAAVDHPLAQAYVGLKAAKTAKEVADIIFTAHAPRELVPTQWLNEPSVWQSLLLDMGLGAVIRNLGKMGSIGLLSPLSDTTKLVCTLLRDPLHIKKARLHPFNVLLAAGVYASGKGVKGKLTWQVNPAVVSALDNCFHLAFQTIEPANKNILIALDVSRSMSTPIQGTNISSAEAAAAMAMATARIEPHYHIVGFAQKVVDLGISHTDYLKEVCRKTSNHNFGATDCAAAIEWARVNKIPVEVFAVYTDNETWRGPKHAFQALEQYRRETGIRAKLACVGFTATQGSIADGDDPLSMNFVGLDASLPAAIAAFSSL